MSDSLISVIVPVYNSELTLNRCIDSLLGQTYRNFELLLINDGSNDRSGEICDEYARKDSRVKVFHKENGGVSSARNVGLDNARGEWVTFVDSDDWVEDTYLDNYSINDNNSIDLICQGYITTKPVFLYGYHSPKENGTYEYAVKCNDRIQTVIPQMFKGRVIHFLWIMAFKRIIINQNNLRFDERLDNGEDLVFILKYLSFSHMVTCFDRFAYHYAVPEWGAKYARSFEKEIMIGEQLYDSIRQIYKVEPNNELCRYYREDLVSKYLQEFCINPSNRKFCLRRIRKILQKDFRYSQIFIMTRIIILFDCSYLFSKVILMMHLWFKNELTKVNGSDHCTIN